MTIKRVLFLGVLALAMPWNAAQAGWRIGVGIGFPGYYRPYYPYRVYVAPGPYYVVQAPVYVQPQPVYVQPAPVYLQAPPPPPAAVQPPPAPLQSYNNLPPQPVPIIR
jgi:hypothetical protein